MSAKLVRLILASCGLGLIALLIPELLPELMIGPLAFPTLLVLGLITIGLIVMIVNSARAEAPAEKPKRDDAYRQIDRLINELDPEERDYLLTRLTEPDAPAEETPVPPEPDSGSSAVDADHRPMSHQ